VFHDRRHAGRMLAEHLAVTAAEDPIVIGLPRGGVPVAAEVARALEAPLDVVVVRKLGHPSQPELGLGAIAEGGYRIVNQKLTTRLGVSAPVLDRVTLQEVCELQRRVRCYRRGRPPIPVESRTVIVVDDGLATGFTARAGIGALRARGAQRVILAVPVAPPEVAPELQRLVDEFVCLEEPLWFFSVGEFYDKFDPVSDEEVAGLLDEAANTLRGNALLSPVSRERPSPTSGRNLADPRVLHAGLDGLQRMIDAASAGTGSLVAVPMRFLEQEHR
jgi:putative phosphoribosyl transferase